jgi:hypothetical protein
MTRVTRRCQITALALAVFGSLALAQGAAADPPGRVARVSQVVGPVSFRPATINEWGDAVPNYPLTSGDDLWTDRAARSEVQLGGATARLGANTSFGVLNLDDRIAQFEVTQGSVELTVDQLSPDEVYEVDTPNGAVSFLRPGFYRVDVNDAGDATTVTVRQGEANVTASDGRPIGLTDNQAVSLLGLENPRADVSRVNAPDEWEDWCRWRDTSEHGDVSARYVSPDTVGYSDLDEFGTWRNVAEYGPVWVPQVRSDWAPYREGRWIWTDAWGWTWVDDQPWGFAPSHYGRWVNMAGVWGWSPGTRVERAIYAPALVAFIGSPGGPGAFGDNTVAWFPLGPGDAYVPPYQASANYLRAINVTNARNESATRVNYVNQAVPGAVTAIPRGTFVNAGRVAAAARNVPVETARQARVAGTAPPVAPSATSLIAKSGTRVAEPPAPVVQRRVVARVAPPPPAVPFAARESAIEGHPGHPVDPKTLGDLRAHSQPAVAAPPVRVVNEQPRGTEPPARANQARPAASAPVVADRRPNPAPAHASEPPEQQEQSRVTAMPKPMQPAAPPPGPPQPARAQAPPEQDKGQLAAQQSAERARLEAQHATEQAQFEAQKADQERRTAQNAQAQQQLRQQEQQQKRELDQRQMRDHQQLQQQQQAERQRQAAQPQPKPKPQPQQTEKPKDEKPKPK